MLEDIVFQAVKNIYKEGFDLGFKRHVWYGLLADRTVSWSLCP